MYEQILRGQIYYANLDPSFGSEQGGTRPVLIIQNDMGNRHSPTLIVVAITSRLYAKNHLPTHHVISHSVGLKMDSIALLEQIRTIDKRRLSSYVGMLSISEMKAIDKKLKISLGIKDEFMYIRSLIF